MEEEVNLLDYYFVLKKRWKIIFYLFFVTVIVSTIISFQLPKIYRAKATIFVVSGKGGLPSFVPHLPVPVDISSLAGGTSSDYLVALLKSNTLAKMIINNLKLYKNKTFIGKTKEKITEEKLIKKLKDATKITDNKKGLIEIQVDTKSSKLSADIANEYVKVLDKYTKNIESENVKFLRERLNSSKKELTLAEENLKKFQEKNKGIALDKQAEALIEQYVGLKSEKLSTHVALQQVSSLAKEGASLIDLAKLEAEKIALSTKDKELSKNISSLESQFLSLPQKSLQFARLLREVKLQGVIFEMLSQQYEIAKITEQKENVKFQIIDKAYPPEKHYKPNKKMNVLIAGMVSLFFGIFLAFFLEYLENIKTQQRRA